MHSLLPNSSERELTEWLDAWCVHAEVPAASAAILRADGSALTLLAGQLDPDPASPWCRAPLASDRFLAGSVGKTFVAAWALDLWIHGVFDMDARIADQFDAATVLALETLPNFAELTPRHLLHHQSGLPRYVFHPDFWKRVLQTPEPTWQHLDRLQFVLGAEPLFAPGAGWAYSDTNYVLLAWLLEALTGTAFEAAVMQRFVAPHRLHGVAPSNQRAIPRQAQAHVRLFAELGFEGRLLDADNRARINPNFESAGGGFATTPTYLAHWAQLYFSGVATPHPNFEALMLGVPADPQLFGPEARYAPGCIRRPTRAGLLLGHDGVMTGSQTTMGWFPERQLAVALQINQDTKPGDPRPLVETLVDLACAV